MSTTRSQKRRNNQQKSTKSVSEGLVSLIVVEKRDISVAGPSKSKSPRIEIILLESLRASLEKEIPSEIKSLLVESQKELIKLLKPKTGANLRENIEEETDNETRSFYTPTRSVRNNSTQNDNPNASRNIPYT